MGLLQEALLGRLGSRFCLNFRPAEQVIYLSPMGRFYDQPVEMGIGLRLNGQTFILPFAKNKNGIHYFNHVEQDFLVEGLEFRVRDFKLGVEFTCKIHAPFYPGDRKVSSAPFFYIDLSVRSFIHGRASFQPIQGEWFFSLTGLNEINIKDGLITSPISSKVDHNCWYYSDECPPQSKSAFSESIFTGEIAVAPLSNRQLWNINGNFTNVCFTKPFLLESARQNLKESLVIAAYQSGPVLQIHHQDQHFLYTAYFQDSLAVMDFACDEREQLLKKNALFTDTITNSTIGEAAKFLISCGFQNYLANTWWVQGDCDDYFFVWEGWCSFHSTLDVEYNNAWFALLYWPELLEKQLESWYLNLQPEGFPSHDLGILLEVNKQVYPHHMPVEESCNLVLLTYAIWRFKGYLKWREYVPQLMEVIQYLLASDTSGNGYPNLGVANTVDDAAATVQYAKEQTYLAVKVLATLTAFSELTRDVPESTTLKLLLQKSDQVIANIRNTMENQAWLGDHYAVCLPQPAKELKDIWTGKQVQEADLIGWDAYSLYTSNGLLWLLATGVRPDVDYNRLIIDLQNSTNESITPYGCTHSSIDRSNVWLSQNMWRDQIAAYLGLDYSAMAERYWRFLEWENSQGRGGCFVDTYGWNWLSYYPRGATAFGMLHCLLGMQINAAKRQINLAPVRWPCRFPLVILADWQTGIIPWVECRVENGELLCRLDSALPDIWRISLSSTLSGSLSYARK
jgi:hypothetical protein